MYGGNEIRLWDFDCEREITFESKPYLYQRIQLNRGASLRRTELSSWTAYVLFSREGITFKMGDRTILAFTGDTLQIEKTDVLLEGTGTILIAGTSHDSPLPTSVSIKKADQVKRVSKHWGYELWLNAEHPNYAFKRIFISKGTRTSLQYHQMKAETNVLIDGNARLHFQENLLVPIDQVSSKDLSFIDLKSGTSIGVKPMTLHRLEALSDITLCEVSTPHLDDVVRISDDQNRPNGRIEAEHQTQVT